MGGKKKKGGKPSGDDDKYDPTQMTLILVAQVQSLKERLVLEQERKDKSLKTVDDIRSNEQDLCKSLEQQQSNTKMIVNEMTEQYKRMEKRLQERIDTLNKDVAIQKDDISRLDNSIGQLKNEKEDMISQKDDEIRELKKRIDEMSSDFAEMLKDTLTKMQERIEFANKQWEDDNDANMLKKFEEMAGGR